MLLSDAFNTWETEIKPAVVEQYGDDDMPAMSESWSEYTDSLCKDGELSPLQYHYCPSWDDDMPGDEEERDWMLTDCLGLTFSADPIAERPDGLMDDSAQHWECVISRGTLVLPVYFSQGSAHTDAPTLEDVLYCIVQDVASYEVASSFEDWAGDMGFICDECGQASETTRGGPGRLQHAATSMICDQNYYKPILMTWCATV